jgi:putative hemolysin
MIETAFQINIGQIIQKKTGKTLPKVAVRLLEKLIHQDELNEFLATDGKDKVGLDFVKASLKFLGINVKIIGEENLKIDENSRLCFVCNHPLGGIDGLIMLKVIGEKCDGNVKVIVNSFLAELPGLAPFVVPVDVAGGKISKELLNVNSIFESDSQIIMFPAQLCSRKQRGVIKDLPWKKRFITHSIKYDRTVVPVYFDGLNSKAFYNFGKFSKFLSKLFNVPGLAKLPMAFLPHEMMKNRGKTFTIVIGDSNLAYSSYELKEFSYFAESRIKEQTYSVDEFLAGVIQDIVYFELKPQATPYKSL